MASTALTGIAYAQSATTPAAAPAAPAVNCATAPAGTPGCPAPVAAAKPAAKPVKQAQTAPAAAQPVDIGTVVVAAPSAPVVLSQPGLTASPTDLLAARAARKAAPATASTPAAAAASTAAANANSTQSSGIPGRPTTPGGVTGADLGGGYIIPETATKTRSTVTRDAIDKQSPTANPYQLINLLPGVVQSSVDNTGLNGGDIHLRGFKSDHVGLTIEGAPINDSGSYSLFPQEYVDAQNIGQISIAQGSPDLDSPHIGAIGGVINIYTRDPAEKAGGYFDLTIGPNNLKREFIRGETGQIGAFRSYLSYSNLTKDHWSGVGNDDRKHLDFKTVGTISPGNTVSFDAIYNVGINDFYVAPTLAQFQDPNFQPNFNPALTGQFFNKTSPINQSTTGLSNTTANPTQSSNGNFYQYRVNPFRNLILSAPSSFTINDKLKFDTTPYFWYGFGSGGGTFGLNETTGFNWGNVKVTNVDFNNNGNTKDTSILFYNPSITETYRPGVVNKFTYNMGDHSIVAGNWFEYATHHQYGPYEALNADGTVPDYFATSGNFTLPTSAICTSTLTTATTTKGQVVACPTGEAEKREQLTKTMTNELFIGDTWKATKDLTINYGVKQAFVNRTVEDGMPNSSSPSNSLFDTATLPTAGLSYQVNKENKVFGSVATSFRSAPNFTIVPNYSSSSGQTTSPISVAPETGTTYEIGHRFQNKMFATSVSAFYGLYNNYQQSTNIPDPSGSASTISVTTNVGRVQNLGLDAEIGTAPINNFRFYSSAELLRSTYLDDLPVSFVSGGKVVTDYLPTSGKQLTEAPSYQLGLGVDYDNGHLFANASYKYTGAQYSTNVNDEQMKAYGRLDMGVGYRFADYGFMKQPQIKLNVYNVLNARQLTGVSGSTSNAQTQIGTNGNTLTTGLTGGGSPSYRIGEGASALVTFSSGF